MKAVPRRPDIRIVLFVGVAALVGLGWALRSGLAMPPSLGRRVNLAIERGVAEPAAAAQDLQDLVAERPEDADLWRRAGVALGRANRPFEAAVYLKKAVELDGTSSTIRVECAKALIRAGLPLEAAELVDSGLAEKPDDGGLLYMASAVAAVHGDAARAGDFYRRAVALDAWEPDRFRHDATFDAVRNDPGFLSAVYDARMPDSFLPREETP